MPAAGRMAPARRVPAAGVAATAPMATPAKAMGRRVASPTKAAGMPPAKALRMPAAERMKPAA
jgi:hypothetical protein